MSQPSTSEEFSRFLKSTIRCFPLGDYHLRRGGLYMKHKEDGVEEGAVWRPVELTIDSRMSGPVKYMDDPECDFEWVDIQIFEEKVDTHDKFPILHRTVTIKPFYKVGRRA